ncbi:MAG: YciI family protein [Acidobacteriaceae bacterium]
MPKQHFYFKLIPPRPSFAVDASAEELALMKTHSDYCGEQFRAGKLLLYGPVLAQEGAFGVAILEVQNEAEARQFGENDPSVLAGLNRFEISPMRVSGSQASGNRQ